MYCSTRTISYVWELAKQHIQSLDCATRLPTVRIGPTATLSPRRDAACRLRCPTPPFSLVEKGQEMRDEQLQRAVAQGLLVGLEGPLAGVIALELDASLEDQQGGGSEGGGRYRVEIALARGGRLAGHNADRIGGGGGLGEQGERRAGQGALGGGAGGLGRWLSGFEWRWRRRGWSFVGLRGEGSEVGVAPDGFELLFVGGGGVAMEGHEIGDLTFRFVRVVRFEERLDRAGHPPAGIHKIALVVCKGTQVSVREGGGVPVALLLLDGEGFKVQRLRRLKVSLLSRDTCQLAVGNGSASAVTVLLRDG